jgi:hypothetical protein
VNNTVPQEHTLVFLINALGRRQRQWHKLDDPTDEFPDCSSRFSPESYNKSHDQEQQQHHHHHNNTIGPIHNNTPKEQHPCRSNDHSNSDNKDQKRKEAGEHALCLMLVKHAMDMVKSLDIENV